MQTRDPCKKALIAAAILLSAAGIAGCSGEDDASGSTSPAAAIRELQDALEAGDVAAACDRMPPKAGEIAHGETTSCERNVRRALTIMSRGGLDTRKRPAVVRVDARGDHATAAVELESGQATNVALLEEGGAWKVASLLGMPLRQFDELEDDLQARHLPPSDSGAVELVDGKGVPCPDLRNGNYPRVTGGCVFEVSGRNVPIRLLSVAGDFELARCSVAYRVAASSSGRTWTSKVTFDDLLRPECSEIEPCLTETWTFRPWTGQITSDGDGDYTHRMLMCLRTGVALVGGELVVHLVRDGKGWKARPTDDGDAGFEIDSELTVKGAPFGVRRRGPVHPGSLRRRLGRDRRDDPLAGLEMSLCQRLAASSEGSRGFICEAHLEFTEVSTGTERLEVFH